MSLRDFWDNVSDPLFMRDAFAEVGFATGEMVRDLRDLCATDGRELVAEWGKVVEVLDARLGDREAAPVPVEARP